MGCSVLGSDTPVLPQIELCADGLRMCHVSCVACKQAGQLAAAPGSVTEASTHLAHMAHVDEAWVRCRARRGGGGGRESCTSASMGHNSL